MVPAFFSPQQTPPPEGRPLAFALISSSDTKPTAAAYGVRARVPAGAQRFTCSISAAPQAALVINIGLILVLPRRKLRLRNPRSPAQGHKLSSSREGI